MRMPDSVVDSVEDLEVDSEKDPGVSVVTLRSLSLKSSHLQKNSCQMIPISQLNIIQNRCIP